MTYLESMNSGKSTFTGGIPAGARQQDPKGFTPPQGDNNYLADYADFLKTVGPKSKDDFVSDVNSAKTKRETQPAGGPSGAGVATSAEELDYLNADLAKHYGMDKSTAYNEAMANTAYQRSMADMKAAGLTPALLAQSGYGTPAQVTYATAQRSGSGSGSGSGSSSASSGAGLWQGLASLVAGAAALAFGSGGFSARQIATVAGQSAKLIYQGTHK